MHHIITKSYNRYYKDNWKYIVLQNKIIIKLGWNFLFINSDKQNDF